MSSIRSSHLWQITNSTLRKWRDWRYIVANVAPSHSWLIVAFCYQGSIKSFADDSKRLRVAKSKKSLVKRHTEQSEKRDAQRKDSSHERKESHGLHGFTRHIRQKSNPKHSSKESDEKEDSQKHHGFLHFRGGRAGKPTHVYVHIHSLLCITIRYYSQLTNSPSGQPTNLWVLYVTNLLKWYVGMTNIDSGERSSWGRHAPMGTQVRTVFPLRKWYMHNQSNHDIQFERIFKSSRDQELRGQGTFFFPHSMFLQQTTSSHRNWYRVRGSLGGSSPA